MKLFILILISQMAMAITKDDVKNIANQLENRNWLHHSVKYAREGRLAYYSDLELISFAKTSSQRMANMLNELDEEEADYFFPELGVNAENTPSMLAYSYSKNAKTYEQLEGMSDLFAVLATERWNDPDEINCNTSAPVADEDCGRRRKVQWVFNHLNAVQRENLPEFKALVLSELDQISKLELGIPAGPEAARIYQVILDAKSIQKLFSQQYLSYSDELDQNVQLKNQIAILQSALYQAFINPVTSPLIITGSESEEPLTGKLESSELDTIELEKASCVSLGTELEINQCILDDLKVKFANFEYGAPQESVQNLMLDRKFLKAVVESVIGNSEVDTFSTEDLYSIGDSYFAALGVIYQTDYVTYKSTVADSFKSLVKNELLGLGEYLLTTEDIRALQLSKSIQHLLADLEI